jgi:putative ABC transport system permease protein
VFQDFRYAVRRAASTPLIVFVAAVSLGLSAGMTAVLVGILDRLLLQPPAHVREASRIVRLQFSQDPQATASLWTAFPNYQVLSRERTGLSGLSAYAAKTIVIGRGAEAREASAELVSANYFTVLGVHPVAGRFFGADEETSAPSVIIVSAELARRLFLEPQDAVGRSIHIGERAFTVVGVAPERFSGVDKGRIDLWLPISAASNFIDPRALTSTMLYWVSLFGRLDGASAEEVSQRATTALRAQVIDGTSEDSVRVQVGPLLANDVPGRSQQVRLLSWIGASAALLLLIACANVANLLLARFLSDRQQLSTRAALGASSMRLVNHVVNDAAIITLLGGLIATGIVQWGGSIAGALLPSEFDAVPAALSLRVLTEIWALMLLAGLVCACPAIILVAKQRHVMNRVHGGDRSPFQRVVGSALVVAQCAVGVVLLIGAGLFGRSLYNVRAIDLGFDIDRLVYASADLKADLGRADTISLYENLSDRIAHLPGVDGVAMAAGLPFRTVWAVAMTLPSEIWKGPNPVVLGRAVGPDYFRVSGLRMVRGREFEHQEQASAANVAIINESFARTFWAGENPIGTCVLMGGDTKCTKIIGVAADTPRWSVSAEREHEVYIPLSRRSDALGSKRTLGLAIRTNVDPDAMVLPIRVAIQSASPHVAYAPVMPVRTILAPQIRPWLIGASVFSSFGVVALVLSAIGLYGLLAFFVAREKRSIGIRMALGATPGMALRSVATRGAVLAGAGVMAGLFGAFMLAPAVRSLLFGISVRDPLVFAGSALVVLAIAAVASLAAGRRATRVDCAVLFRAG